MDCDTSCPKPPEYPADPLPFRIGKYDGYSVILIFVFIGFVIVFLIATYWVQSGSIGKFSTYRNISSILKPIGAASRFLENSSDRKHSFRTWIYAIGWFP